MQFSDIVYQIKNNEPTKVFAQKYLEDARLFYNKAMEYRTKIVTDENE